MPMVACPEVFGGSPGPEKDCGWYCEFALGSETWVFCATWRGRRGDSAGKHEASTGQHRVASKSRQDQPNGRMLSKHRSAADAGNGSEFYFDLPATSKGLKA